RSRRLTARSRRAASRNYAERRLPTYPETFDGYMALTNPAAAEIAASNFLMKTIANERVGSTIFNMHWTRHVLKNSKFQLLTSDRPIIMPLGLGDPRASIVLPVSPSVVFVAAHDRVFASWLAGQKDPELAKAFNKAVVCQARKFVWATDDSQLEFVRRHIGTAPDRTIITEAQKQEALAAARGELPSGPVVHSCVARKAPAGGSGRLDRVLRRALARTAPFLSIITRRRRTSSQVAGHATHAALAAAVEATEASTAAPRLSGHADPRVRDRTPEGLPAAATVAYLCPHHACP